MESAKRNRAEQPPFEDEELDESTLSADELEAFRRAEEDFRAGRCIPHEQFVRGMRAYMAEKKRPTSGK